MVAEYVGPEGRGAMTARQWLSEEWIPLLFGIVFVLGSVVFLTGKPTVPPHHGRPVSRQEVQLDSLITANQRIAAGLARIADALQKAEAP